jgi:hypothetical protein
VRIPVIVSAVAASAALFGPSAAWAQNPTTTIIQTPSPVPVAGIAPYLEGWTGVSATRTFFGGYIGGVYALNPERNVWSNGFVIRGEAQVGRYETDSVTAPDDHVLTHGGSLLLGYRALIGAGMLTGYVGANYETHNNDDPFAVIRGTEVGFRALLEYYTRLTPVVDFYGQASYSTAFQTGFLFSRVGFNIVDQVWAGPEASYFRNEDNREARLGAFVRFDQTFTGGGITVSGGWTNPLSSTTADGWYANVNFDFQLR